MTLFDMMTLLPSMQSCATCELAKNAQRSPTMVARVPRAVPGFMVTPSRMMHSAPIVRVVASPA
jgi:hypothetical protein